MVEASDHVMQLISLQDPIDDDLLNVSARIFEQSEEEVLWLPQLFYLISEDL
jgi:hypothetical protein